MKQLIGVIGDRLQAAFPPNRICILLATPILAASAWISATVTGNVPGVNLPVGVVSGVMGVIVLATATLLYKWFDQWQKGEPIHFGAEIEELIDELEGKLASSFGAHEAVQGALVDLHGKITRGELNEAQVAHSVDELYRVITEFLAGHHEAPPATEAAVGTLKNPEPAPEAPAQ